MADRQGFERGNEVALRHGAFSESRIRPLARNHRRRILRQLRLRAGDLDPVGMAYLDLFVRTTAKVQLIDEFVAEHGLIRSDGEPQPVMRLYVSLVNSSRLALARLEAHVRARAGDPHAVLRDWIEQLPEEDGDGEGA